MNFDRYILNRNSLNVDESNYWLHRSTLKEQVDEYRTTTPLNKQRQQELQTMFLSILAGEVPYKPNSYCVKAKMNFFFAFVAIGSDRMFDYRVRNFALEIMDSEVPLLAPGYNYSVSRNVRQPDKTEYVNKLRRVFDIKDNPCSILPLKNSLKTGSIESEYENPWPVRPRSRPVHKAQLAVLDLPNIRNDICSNVLDWTSNNHIVAALGKVIWIWNVETAQMLHHIDCCNEVISLKADPRSKMIAFSCKDEIMCALKVWSFQTGKIKTKFRPLDCHHFKCYLTCIEYHTSNKYMIVGCRTGNIGMLDMNLNRLITVRNAHGNLDLIKIKASPDGRYIASCGYDGYVNVWNFADFSLVYSYFETHCSRGLAWHPWKSSLLCVGTSNGKLALLNVALGKCIASKFEENTIIYEVAYNKLSGELVVSQTHCEPGLASTYASQINVLANFHHVVDRFEGHSRRVLFLEWSPDNRTLATAGSDETIHLWNFLEKKSECKKKNVTKLKQLVNFDNFIR